MNDNKTQQQIKIARILADSLKGDISKNDKVFLEKWLKQSPSNKFFYNRFLEEDKLEDKLKDYKNIDISKAKGKVEKRHKKNIFLKNINKYFKYAAIVVAVSGSFYFFQDSFFSNQDYLDNLPSDAITLELEDGNIEIIAEDGTRKLVDKKGKVIGEQQGNKLNYKGPSQSEELVYNELNIPYGKTFEIVLSDGTKVHLNAGSSLKYPVKFITGENRKVFLKGEAFFDVTKDEQHPFVVNTNELNIRVLGTSFNVSSYPEDTMISTVLVEGSVRLYNADGEFSKDRSSLLKPSYKACWDKEKYDLKMEKVDTAIYTGWTKGKLIFKDMPFKNIRKKLERKYDIKIINNNKTLENNTYNAVFDIETIEQVLETLNKNYPIEYEIKENQIIIY